MITKDRNFITMKPGKNKINKQKGTEICADLLFVGLSRKEIIKEITEKHKACESTIDQWLKAARPIVLIRQQEAEVIRARVSQEEIEASAKRLNLTRERILEEYAKIGFFDIRKVFTVDGGLMPIHSLDDNSAGGIAGIESFDERAPETGELLGTVRKIKVAEKTKALDSICRVLGYNVPEKAPPAENAGPMTDEQVDKIISSLRETKKK